MAAARNRVPHQDVAVQAVHGAAVLGASLGNPVVIVGRAILVWVAVRQRPADANDEDGGIFLQHLGLALLARQVGVHVQDFLGVQERELLRQVGVLAGLELGEHLLGV